MYQVLPPTLQTGAHARAIIRCIARKIDPRVLSARVDAPLARLQRFNTPIPAAYRALIDEAVLPRVVGGATMMRAQPDKVTVWAAGDLGSIQVVPFNAGAHASATSSSDLLAGRTPDSARLCTWRG